MVMHTVKTVMMLLYDVVSDKNVAKMRIFVSEPSVICDFLSSNRAESANQK